MKLFKQMKIGMPILFALLAGCASTSTQASNCESSGNRQVSNVDSSKENCPQKNARQTFSDVWMLK